MSCDWVRRYLAFLGVECERPYLGALTVLTRAHVKAIAFENITSLRRRMAHPVGPVPPLEPEILLSNWEQGRGGGVCYELASMFELLLGALGYRSTLVLAVVDNPGAHQAVLVELDEGSFLVDVGCGAPLFAPIPLDRVSEVHHVGLAYRFRPGEEDNSYVQDRFIQDEWAPLFHYRLTAADEQDREVGYQQHHTPGQSWVAGPPRLVRCTEDSVFSLRDGELVTYRAGGKQSEQIISPDDYVHVAKEIFGLPNLPIAEVLSS